MASLERGYLRPTPNPLGVVTTRLDLQFHQETVWRQRGSQVVHDNTEVLEELLDPYLGSAILVNQEQVAGIVDLGVHESPKVPGEE